MNILDHVGKASVVILAHCRIPVTCTFIYIHGLAEFGILVGESARIRGRYLHGNLVAYCGFVDAGPTWTKVGELIERTLRLEASLRLAEITSHSLLSVANNISSTNARRSVYGASEEAALGGCFKIGARSTLLDHLLVVEALFVVWILSGLRLIKISIRLEERRFDAAKVRVVHLAVWLLLLIILILETPSQILFLRHLCTIFGRMQSERAEHDLVFFHIVDFAKVVDGTRPSASLLSWRRGPATDLRLLGLGGHLPGHRRAMVRLHQAAQGHIAAQECCGPDLARASRSLIRKRPRVTFLLELQRVFQRAEEHLLGLWFLELYHARCRWCRLTRCKRRFGLLWISQIAIVRRRSHSSIIISAILCLLDQNGCRLGRLARYLRL